MHSYGCNQQYASIGLDNGLQPDRQELMIWTNSGLDYGRIQYSIRLASKDND